MKFTTPAEVFSAIEKGFKPEKADRNAVIQVHLNGNNGGDWVLTVQDRQLNVRQGTSDHATMTMSMSAKDWVDMVNGDAKPMSLFMMGKIKVQGDMGLALKLQEMFF
ncbi:MAG TPA: SCP2 sterol-binding domain-containing protein [Anaerolineales bacterium]|nr:SCP2 sterol-binding domain-containing protein [Anaerolineales bacterium]